MKTEKEIIAAYAHDFRDMAMSQDELQNVLKSCADEQREELVREIEGMKLSERKRGRDGFCDCHNEGLDKAIDFLKK